MSLPPGFLDELRSRSSLARIVGRRVTWDQRKSNPGKGDFWAPCPFHQERTASFHVDDRKGFYYCFGCQAKGDMIDFIRETERTGFMEAVEILAREAGMAMPAASPQAREAAERRTSLAEVMEQAVQFYRLRLHAAKAGAARDYLARRGLTEAALARFEIGFAPEERTALLEALGAKGVPLPLLVEAGLVHPDEPGRPAGDRFRGRIMFPIRDARGRAIGFGARAIRPGQEPKYLNSPETPLFDKGRTLYNHGPAREAAGRTGRLILAEGYMDVIALVEAGFAHAVAPLGTAVTADQLRLAWAMADEPVVALDGDAAGMRAALRLADLALPLLEPGKSLGFATLPRDQDPDELIRNGGAAAMQAVLGKARPLIDLLWQRETEARLLDTPERRAAFDQALRERLKAIADPGVRSHYAAEFRARRAALFRPSPRPQPVRQGTRRAGYQPGAPPGGRGAGGGPPAGASAAARATLLAREDGGPATEARVRECAILCICLNHPALAGAREGLIESITFLNRDLEALRAALFDALPLALASPDPRAALDAALTARLGQPPLPRLTALGQIGLNPHLGPGADPAMAAAALDEELMKQAAWAGLRSEEREAAEELAADPNGAVAWRLIEAAEALDRARRGYNVGGDSAAAEEESHAAHLQRFLDEQIWVKRRR
jgi:DNA primase